MKVSVKGEEWILLAFWLLVIPLKWIIAFLFAAAFHELFHYVTALLAGGTVTNIEIGPGGAVMAVSRLSELGEVTSILAGPLGGLLLLAFWRIAPRIALCGMIQSLYNMIPVYPLDGGRVLELLIGKHLGNSSVAKIRAFCTFTFSGVTFLLAVIFRLPGLVLLLIPVFREKLLAKRREKGYNRATIIKG